MRLEQRVQRLERKTRRWQLFVLFLAIAIIATFVVWDWRVGGIDAHKRHEIAQDDERTMEVGAARIEATEVFAVHYGSTDAEAYLAFGERGARFATDAATIVGAWIETARPAVVLVGGKAYATLEVDTQTGAWTLNRHWAEYHGQRPSPVLTRQLLPPLSTTPREEDTP